MSSASMVLIAYRAYKLETLLRIHRRQFPFSDKEAFKNLIGPIKGAKIFENRVYKYLENKSMSAMQDELRKLIR